MKNINLKEWPCYRSVSSADNTFKIDAAGDITLTKPVDLEVHYYEIVIVAKNPAPGPSGKFEVRFYPITEDYTFEVRTENYQNFDEKSFIEDLTDLRASDDRPIINDISIVSNEGTAI